MKMESREKNHFLDDIHTVVGMKYGHLLIYVFAFLLRKVEETKGTQFFPVYVLKM
jgi:hypothetical protein